MCYHCSIVFENKKVLRQHITKRHMVLEESESEDEINLIQNDEIGLQHKKQRKINNENKATTMKKRQERKCLRVAGKSYVSVKGSVIKKKEKPIFSCTNCPLKCSTKFSENEKDEFFLAFWKMGEDDKNQDRQRQYVASHVVEAEPERRRVNIISRKKRSLHYYLEKDTERVRVCRKFFFSVFSITEKFVRVSLEKKNDVGIVSVDGRGKQSSANKIPAWIEEHARKHILSFPTVESHYCRKSSNKLYLSSQLNIEKLYTLYEEKCKEDNLAITVENENSNSETMKSLIKPVSKSQYKVYFYSYGNLRFHKPKKDQCNICNRYESLSVEEKETEKDQHNKHLKNKERVREIKKEKNQ
ncbi:hypothetical protein J6590_108245 [Homalodisca vitripennis]|nr:hypothetical protein J6590_108245 [Homalodisca vitripennis]